MTNPAFQRLTKAWSGAAQPTDPSAIAPLRTVVVPPSGFAATWPKRPSEPLRLGLRLLSEQELLNAAALAEQEANAECPDGTSVEARGDSFGSHLMTNVLARALTDQADALAPFFPQAPEVACRGALVTGTVQRLWEAYGKMAAEESPLSREADADDLEELADRLLNGSIALLAEPTQRRIRRIVGELVDELRDAPRPVATEEPHDEAPHAGPA